MVRLVKANAFKVGKWIYIWLPPLTVMLGKGMCLASEFRLRLHRKTHQTKL